MAANAFSNAEGVRKLLPGDPSELGARCTDDGVLFSVYSAAADALELCLFDAAGLQVGRERFDARADGVWHGFLPGAQPGLQYGFRAHGRFAPDEGTFFNPNRLLLDPYARALAGRYVGHPANHVCALAGSDAGDSEVLVRAPQFDSDNAAFVPRSVVTGALSARQSGVRVANNLRVIYEAHTSGLTQLNDAVDKPLRGSFLGVAAPAVISHLRSLGITSLQLLPVHSFIDEPHLLANGLSNYWGYNTLNFFTPHSTYAAAGYPAAGMEYDHVRRQFRDMVRALHDANIEVLLDVVYNHTCEGGADGPVSSFRGLDNLAYYRTDAMEQHRYINDTGCGNTLDFNSPAVQRLTLDSLRYFSQDLEVDGFRFDLAVSLGREPDGFAARHPLFEAMREDPVLSHSTFIAEPWDVGPGGYQTGGFAAPWMEWNDRYRDSLRSFWRGDAGAQADMGKRLHGSSDLFENSGRSVHTSVNFLSAHDGFTLADVVAYADKHNVANGEDNCDGHSHNLSDNMGAEGLTDNACIIAARDRRSRAMLATLIFSQGTPMLLAGDELRNSQQGNNNAYCQDNPIGWLQWDEVLSAHVNLVRLCLDVRKSLGGFRLTEFVHAPWRSAAAQSGGPSIGWLRSDATVMQDQDWMHDAAPTALPFAQLLATSEELLLIALNPSFDECVFVLPLAGAWRWRVNSEQSSGKPLQDCAEGSACVPAQSVSLFSIAMNNADSAQFISQLSSALNSSAPPETS